MTLNHICLRQAIAWLLLPPPCYYMSIKFRTKNQNNKNERELFVYSIGIIQYHITQINPRSHKIGTNHEALYSVLDLPPLSQHRYVQRMTTLFDILRSDVAGRLNRSSVTAVQDRNPYPTRRGLDLTLPLPRSEHTRRSFLQTAIVAWNRLPTETRNLPSRTSLKNKLIHAPRPNPYFAVELSRMAQVNLTRLRSGYHNLNGRLSDIGLAESAACDCGSPREDVQHFLIDCRCYDDLRRDVTEIPIEAWQVETLLHGNKRYSQELNHKICITVQRYISWLLPGSKTLMDWSLKNSLNIIFLKLITMRCKNATGSNSIM